MKLTDKQVLMMIGAGGVLLWYVKSKAENLVGDVGEAINPVNSGNVFHTGVNIVGSRLSGNPNFSLGSFIYEMTHDDEVF